MKKNNKNTGLPLLNQVADGKFNAKKITYKNIQRGKATQVYSSNKSIFIAGIIRDNNKVKKYRGVFLEVMEIRSGMPMIEFFYKLSPDSEYIVTELKPALKLNDTLLCFPIDDEDEANTFALVNQIVMALDLTKLKVI